MGKNTILIGCDVVVKELSHRIGKDLVVRTLDPSLHVSPDRLRSTLQGVIDEVFSVKDGLRLAQRPLQSMNI